MDQTFLLVVVGMTSVGGYLVGVGGLGLRGRQLRAALRMMVGCLGMAVCFSVINFVITVVGILLLRSVTGKFVSLYIAENVAWPMLSLLQALTFTWWRELSKS